MKKIHLALLVPFVWANVQASDQIAMEEENDTPTTVAAFPQVEALTLEVADAVQNSASAPCDGTVEESKIEREIGRIGDQLDREIPRIQNQFEREADRIADQIDREAPKVVETVEREADRVVRQVSGVFRKFGF